MRFRGQALKLVLPGLLAGLTMISPAFGKDKTYKGEVSDAMCGASHMMDGSKAECAMTCVRKGSNYALVVGDKVYTLETSDKALLGQLEKLAGQQAEVSGAESGDSIAVKTVAAAK